MEHYVTAAADFPQPALNSLVKAAYYWVIQYDRQKAPSASLNRYCLTQFKKSLDFAAFMGLKGSWQRALREWEAGGDGTAFWAFMFKVRERRTRVAGNPQVSAFSLKFLQAHLSYTRSESATALKFLTEKAGALASPEINQELWKKEKGKSQEKGVARIVELVKELGGRRYAEYLTLNEMKALKENGDARQLKLLAEYQKLTKEASGNYKGALKGLVASSGKVLMDVKEARKLLKEQGITRVGIPQGFVGQVDADGKLYTSDGDRLALTPTCPVVTMNPKYDGESMAAYCFGSWPDAVKASTGKVQLVSYQTEKQVANRGLDRSQKLSQGFKKLGRMQRAWHQLMLSNKPFERALGCSLQFLYQCSQRVGSEFTQSKGGSTYGGTTFEVRHCKVTGSTIRIKFPTKSDGLQDIKLVKGQGDKWAKLLWQRLHDEYLREGLPAKAKVWDYGGKYIVNKDINRWLKQFDPAFTSHMFRGLNATRTMSEELEKLSFRAPSSRGKADTAYQRELNQFHKKVTDAYLKAAEAVGKELGHFNQKGVAVNTAIGSYIDHQLTRDFFEKNGVPLPAKIANLMKELKEI